MAEFMAREKEPPRDMFITAFPERLLARTSSTTEVNVLAFPSFCFSLPGADKKKRQSLTPLHSVKDTSGIATTLSIKNLDSNKVNLLRNAKSPATNGASNVASVAILIGIGAALDKVGTESSAALELGVRSPDTSVDDVRGDALATASIEDVATSSASVPQSLSRKTNQAEGGILLRSDSRSTNTGNSLNVSNLGLISNGEKEIIVRLKGHSHELVVAVRIHASREERTREAALVDVSLLDVAHEEGLLRLDGLSGEGGVPDDKVAVRDDVGGIGVGDGQADKVDAAEALGEGREGEEKEEERREARSLRSHCLAKSVQAGLFLWILTTFPWRRVSRERR